MMEEQDVTEPRGHVVVIDDDHEMRSLLVDFFTGDGYMTSAFASARQALAAITAPESNDVASIPIDLVISDIKMPQMTGTEFTSALKKARPYIPVILITAFGSIESAIESIKNGAYDYVVKPFKLAELGVTAARAIEYRRLQSDNQALRKEVRQAWNFDKMAGKSPAMQGVFRAIRLVSQATANVLITGESGTGKEMVARAIHDTGPRRNKPFIAINCTAIPENLMESELFGHAKGSFTGATQRKIGLFEEANGGTLFLDEIGDMDPTLQAKLLRVLQDKAIRPVGENVERRIDVRVIAATHKNLKTAINQGRFREDLYYRLSVIPIVIPPLRHRREDIPLLVDYFFHKYRAANAAAVQRITPAAMKRLMAYPWHGNVRELENLIERLVVMCTEDQIDEAAIPDADPGGAEDFFGAATSTFPTLDALEKRYIKLVLEKTGGRKERAAHILGINRRTLYRKEADLNFSSHTVQENKTTLDQTFHA